MGTMNCTVATSQIHIGAWSVTVLFPLGEGISPAQGPEDAKKWIQNGLYMDTIVYLREADNGAGDSSNVDALQSTRESCVLHHLLLRKENEIVASPMLTIED